METNEERIIDVDLEIGGEDIDTLDLERELIPFLKELRDLSNKYGIALVGCEDSCGTAVMMISTKHIERYKMTADHIWPEYAEIVLAA